MAKAVAREIAAPCKLRTGHKSVEESRVQVFKDGFQVVRTSLGGIDPLATAYLPHQMGSVDDVSARDISSVKCRVPPFNDPAIHLCQKNVSNGSYNTVRRGFQEVGETNPQLALSQPDGAIYIRKGKELYCDLRDGCARTQLAITFLKDLKQLVGHYGFRLARAFIHSG